MLIDKDVKLEIKVETPNRDKPEEKVIKVKRPLQKWKSYPSGVSQREGSLRGGRKWSKAAMADVLQIDDKPLPKLNEDEEAVGIITMEDVIEELLQVNSLLDINHCFVHVKNFCIFQNLFPDKHHLFLGYLKKSLGVK